jgi:hypothetical protein
MEAAMTSELDTRETEATARQMALAAITKVDRLAFEECAQAIAQERAARERAEALLREAIQTLNDIAQWDQGPAGPGHDEPSSAEAAQKVLGRLNTMEERNG